MGALKELLKQPYWIVSLILGAGLVILPCITVEKDHGWISHAPTTLWPVGVGIGLLLASLAAFWFSLSRRLEGDPAAGLDLTRVHESKGILWTNVAGCEIQIVFGRVEDFSVPGVVMVLPCNEYFDDLCAGDPRSALGAYLQRNFEGQAREFTAAIREECRRTLRPGVQQRRTDNDAAESFGVGQCVLLEKPLHRSTPFAVVSTTTQRPGEGLSGRISYLFEAMRGLVRRLGDARLNEVVMPLMGAGHGGIDPPLALVGLLLAIAEVARYAPAGRPLRRTTIIVFQKDSESPPSVDRVVARRALALIGSRE